MVITRTSIQFTAWYKGEKYELQTCEGEYRKLMVLLCGKIYIEGFGACKGLGRCDTSLIKAEGLHPALNTLYRNETSTLYKTGILQPNKRIACQIFVDENLKNVTVQVTGNK